MCARGSGFYIANIPTGIRTHFYGICSSRRGSSAARTAGGPFLLASRIASYFGLEAAGTTVRREMLAGVTTFVTMSYIIAVNPAILKAAGTSLDRVVSATVILLEETDFAGMNEEWIKWFPVNPPARQGAKLPVRIPGMRVSIAAIAEA